MDAAEFVRKLPPEERATIDAARRILFALTVDERKQLLEDIALLAELARRGGANSEEAAALAQLPFRWARWALRGYARKEQLKEARSRRPPKITPRKYKSATLRARSRKELASLLGVSLQAVRDFEALQGFEPAKF